MKHLILPVLLLILSLAGPFWFLRKSSPPKDPLFPSATKVECYTIEGDCRTPGRFPLRPGMTLMAGISRAGGSSGFSLPWATIRRRGDVLHFDMRRLLPDGSNNPQLENGDLVIVGE